MKTSKYFMQDPRNALIIYVFFSLCFGSGCAILLRNIEGFGSGIFIGGLICVGWHYYRPSHEKKMEILTRLDQHSMIMMRDQEKIGSNGRWYACSQIAPTIFGSVGTLHTFLSGSGSTPQKAVDKLFDDMVENSENPNLVFVLQCKDKKLIIVRWNNYSYDWEDANLNNLLLIEHNIDPNNVLSYWEYRKDREKGTHPLYSLLQRSSVR